MKLIAQIRLALIILLAWGCGRHELPYIDNSRDEELYAQNVRTLVLGLADAARSSSEPQIQINLIVKELSQGDRPVGQYKQIYADLLATSRRILDRCPPGSARPDIRKEIDELTSLARKLSPKS